MVSCYSFHIYEVFTTLSLLYINELLDDVICNFTINADDTSFYSINMVSSHFWTPTSETLGFIPQANHPQM